MNQSFASDNTAGIHPKVLAAIADANGGPCLGYGDDDHTRAAIALFQTHFGDAAEIHFLFNGTGANVTGLKAVMQSHHAILCAETAHIRTAECGAPEKWIGCQVLTVPTPDGKLTPDLLAPWLAEIGNAQHSQPRVVSITQVSEYGTVYTPAEIRAIADFAHRHGMLLHLDGARLANAAASLDVPLRAITTDAGVDVLSFGGTKNGLMLGEAVVFPNGAPTPDFKFIRKQSMQLASKMRFISAQFSALLTDDLWLENARHANAMARYFADRLAELPDVRLTQRVQSNAIFAAMPEPLIKTLKAQYAFYIWDETVNEVRLMTAFDTTCEAIDAFIVEAKRCTDTLTTR